MTAEQRRLAEAAAGAADWQHWGTYVSDRAWGTVREDYSKDGSAWEYFPHDHARSRAYRWNEDALAGFCDRDQYLCMGLALWNERDPILKERLFGLSNAEGNHGEDVKEYFFYLDNTPTHAYARMLYKYPQVAFPYADLVAENRRRGSHEPEYELFDAVGDAFRQNRYFDVFIEYAKNDPEDILCRVRIVNRGPDAAPIHVLPLLWYRNTWSWNHDAPRRVIHAGRPGGAWTDPLELGARCWSVSPDIDVADADPELLFTENDTNVERLFGATNASPFVKDGINEAVVHDRPDRVSPVRGSKVAAHAHSARRRRRHQVSRVGVRLAHPHAGVVGEPQRQRRPRHFRRHARMPLLMRSIDHPIRFRSGRHRRALAPRQRGCVVAAGSDGRRARRTAGPARFSRPRLRFRRRTLDNPRSDRSIGSRSGSEHGALSAVRLARRGRFCGSPDVGHAVSVRRTSRACGHTLMKVLVIDVGGSNIKILATGRRKVVKIPSGPRMTARKMARLVREASADWDYAAVWIGYPGPVVHGRPASEPRNLGRGWVGFDFHRAFGRPVKVVNDAAMQALGSYKGGRMLFLGLGTGLGTALIVDGVVEPMSSRICRTGKDARTKSMSASAVSRGRGRRNGGVTSPTSSCG